MKSNKAFYKLIWMSCICKLMHANSLSFVRFHYSVYWHIVTIVICIHTSVLVYRTPAFTTKFICGMQFTPTMCAKHLNLERKEMFYWIFSKFIISNGLKIRQSLCKSSPNNMTFAYILLMCVYILFSIIVFNL